MNGDQDKAAFDKEVRRHVYDDFIKRGQAPTIAGTAAALKSTPNDIRASYRRLAEGHVVVLQEGNGEILMANPFSAVPTPFLVESGGRSWWGNCIWDALGIAAMLKGDARIATGCGDCNDSMTLIIKNGSLQETEGIIHFSVPAKRWWDNIKFT